MDMCKSCIAAPSCITAEEREGEGEGGGGGGKRAMWAAMETLGRALRARPYGCLLQAEQIQKCPRWDLWSSWSGDDWAGDLVDSSYRLQVEALLACCPPLLLL